MASLKEAPPEEVAQRMRQIADSLTNPADVAVAKRYAGELELKAARRRKAYWRPRA